MKKEDRHPIRVIFPHKDDMRQPDPRGSSKKIHGEFSDSVRSRLASEVDALADAFADSFSRFPDVPAVGLVTLKAEALAKSHRPDSIFTSHTCPTIGGSHLGKLLISVTPAGIDRLLEEIRTNDTHVGRANLSTISQIDPFTPQDATGGEAASDLASSGMVKFRLFRHKSTVRDHAVMRAFRIIAGDYSLKAFRSVSYGPNRDALIFNDLSSESIRALASFVGTQSLERVPRYRLLRTQSRRVSPDLPANFPVPRPGSSYPLLGIIDTGIDPENAVLSPWVAKSSILVSKGEFDPDHGSFVAGLAVHSRFLNGMDSRFPDVSSRIVDVAGIPSSGEVLEHELQEIIEMSVKDNPEVRVWNLSVCADCCCREDSFSDFATFLDYIQDEYDVTFVVAIGNSTNFQSWPRSEGADRLAPPSDSVRSITVGSLAHRDSANSLVMRECPSPFSRSGPGPACLPKPEVVHYGGNCDSSGKSLQIGVLSIDGSGGISEDIGTSFATPIVSSLVANVDEVLADQPSRNLKKALVVHSALLRHGSVESKWINHRGFGVPGDLAEMLTCPRWSATMIFETAILPGKYFQRSGFPIPDCLYSNGRLQCQIFVTLAYDPPLDSSFGAEYVRTNLDVSLGTQRDGKHNRQIPPVPNDISLKYEKNLVKHGFKWSPIKVYSRQIQRMDRQDWALRVSGISRSSVLRQSQEFVVLVTVADSHKKAPVYEEVTQLMQQLNWQTEDLRVRDRMRARIR